VVAERNHLGAAEAPPQPGALGPELVELRLRIEPARARVTVDGARVAGPSVRVPRDGARHLVRAAAGGFFPVGRTFVAGGDQTLAIKLAKKSTRPKGPRPLAAAEALDSGQWKTLEKLVHQLDVAAAD